MTRAPGHSGGVWLSDQIEASARRGNLALLTDAAFLLVAEEQGGPEQALAWLADLATRTGVPIGIRGAVPLVIPPAGSEGHFAAGERLYIAPRSDGAPCRG